MATSIFNVYEWSYQLFQTVDLTSGGASFTGGDIRLEMQPDSGSGHNIEFSVKGLSELHKTMWADNTTTDVILGRIMTVIYFLIFSN